MKSRKKGNVLEVYVTPYRYVYGSTTLDAHTVRVITDKGEYVNARLMNGEQAIERAFYVEREPDYYFEPNVAYVKIEDKPYYMDI